MIVLIATLPLSTGVHIVDERILMQTTFPNNSTQVMRNSQHYQTSELSSLPFKPK